MPIGENAGEIDEANDRDNRRSAIAGDRDAGAFGRETLVVWRRSKLDLRITGEEIAALDRFMAQRRESL